MEAERNMELQVEHVTQAFGDLVEASVMQGVSPGAWDDISPGA